MIHVTITGLNTEATQKTLKDLDAAMNGSLKDLCNVKGLESISIYPNAPEVACSPVITPDCETPSKGKAPQEQEDQAAPEQEQPVKTYELTEVRAAANAYKDKHGIEKLREIFRKHGGEKFKDIPESNYAALMKEIA